MIAGILITARLGSTRLKRKHLLPVNQQPIISFLIKRIENEFKREIDARAVNIVVTTTDESENREFEQFKSSGVEVFYGATDNIPLRHLQTADFFGLDAMVSVDGDDILCSTAAMRKVYASLTDGSQYVKTSNLPFGINCMGYSRLFLKNSLVAHHQDILETGWGRIFDSGQLIDIQFDPRPEYGPLRFTLDYKEDYSFFKAVIEHFGHGIYHANDEQIIQSVLTFKFYLLNASVNEAYWDNFNKIRNKEISTTTINT